jgi:phosphoesterase RecJ-like protein
MRQKHLAEELIHKAGWVFHLDYNHFKRSGDMQRLLHQCKATRVMIDHHPDPELAAKYVFSEPTASSTCQLLYHILKRWDSALLDNSIATCLYTGMMTDTGNFSYRSTNADTFQTAAELMECKIERATIYENVYDNYSENRMRLMGYCLNELMITLPQYNTAMIGLTLKDQERYGFVVGDNEGLVNLPLSIKGMRFSAFFLEKEDKIKISLRSKENFSVNNFARKHFGGGGHLNAAGGDSKIPIYELMQQFRDLLPQYEKELTQ